ncbi:head-tail connector protein [Burkholderia thailandensis]|uniref:head-tail connector protein n=1 Tax=Burkholderia thailandensis TaxID=57975 RepID=UPI000CC4C869|nr:head-tail connector protein [Burkholderia thailandensis]MCS6490773.1 head-tail connector protein [Burkholderia thailandensis]MCS6518149.1 head-tail connector protein [Burkholderia thailandensis]PJO72419.1 phage gp6-like head-tail connector protein [Burkholderia thailandensis]
MSITLEEALTHVRQDAGIEDEAVQRMIDAATAAAWDYLGVDLSENIPAPVRAVILLQVGDLFANREAVGQGSLGQYFTNPTYERLLNPYRAMSM